VIQERVNILDKAREAEEVIECAQQTGKKLSPNLDIPTDVLYVRTNRTLAIRYRLSVTEVLAYVREVVLRVTNFKPSPDASHATEI
jgi:hypothetical protein